MYNTRERPASPNDRLRILSLYPPLLFVVARAPNVFLLVSWFSSYMALVTHNELSLEPNPV